MPCNVLMLPTAPPGLMNSLRMIASRYGVQGARQWQHRQGGKHPTSRSNSSINTSTAPQTQRHSANTTTPAALHRGTEIGAQKAVPYLLQSRSSKAW